MDAEITDLGAFFQNRVTTWSYGELLRASPPPSPAFDCINRVDYATVLEASS